MACAAAAARAPAARPLPGATAAALLPAAATLAAGSEQQAQQAAALSQMLQAGTIPGLLHAMLPGGGVQAVGGCTGGCAAVGWTNMEQCPWLAGSQQAWLLTGSAWLSP